MGHDLRVLLFVGKVTLCNSLDADTFRTTTDYNLHLLHCARKKCFYSRQKMGNSMASTMHGEKRFDHLR